MMYSIGENGTAGYDFLVAFGWREGDAEVEKTLPCFGKHPPLPKDARYDHQPESPPANFFVPGCHHSTPMNLGGQK